MPPELSPLVPGDPAHLGPYRVIGRLGAGGMGAVYGALDATGRCIAVKVVHERFAADPRFRAAFTREVELVRRVGGLCTAPVLDADPTTARPWMATEFVPGPTLRAHVRRGGPLDGALLLAFAAGTAEALQAVHAAGVMHCDVKPANVILAPDGPKVLDFGIARPVGATISAGDVVFGSPGWMSPERLSGAEPTAAGDVFAWGGLVAFAATGRAPFGHADVPELLRRTREDRPDIADVPDELRDLVERAMAKDPGARPSAEEAFRALMALSLAAGDAGTTAAAGAVADDADAATAETAAWDGESAQRHLGALLRERWTGFGAPWHSPALWLAAAPVLGAAGGTAVAGLLGAGGTAGAAGAASAGAGAGAASAGVGAGTGAGLGAAGAVAAGGAGTGTGAAATGIAGLTGAKIAGIVAAGVLVTGAATGGYAAYGALTALTPVEALDQAARLAADARSFRADSTFTQEFGGAADAAQEWGVEHRYSAEPKVRYSRVVDEENPTIAETVRIGDAPVFLINGVWTKEAPGTDVPLYSEEEFSPRWIAADLRAMADGTDIVAHEDDTELDGVPAAHYTGDYTVTVTSYPTNDKREAPAEFDVWIDEEGLPLRVESTRHDEEVGGDTTERTEFADFNRPVEVEAPASAEIVAGRCGEPVVTSPANGERLVVAGRTPGVTCNFAAGILEGHFTDPDGPSQGSGGFAEYNGWLCGWVSLGMRTEGEPYGSCTETDGDGRIEMYPAEP